MRGKFQTGRWLAAALSAMGLLMGAMLLAVQAEPVHFKQLLPLVDLKIPGWDMEGKPNGMTMKQGKFSISEAKACFRSGDRTLEISIMDFLGQTIPWMTSVQMEMESSEERIRTTQVQGYKALETFRHQDKQGELSIGVADRFWVRIAGEGIDNIEVLQTVAQHLDLKKLATLAK